MANVKAIKYQNNAFVTTSLSLSFLNQNKFLNHNFAIFPGFIDVHVHLREPGFCYKEDIKSGTLACAHGGYTAVCSMPNLNPVPDSKENLNLQLNLIKQKAVIQVYPYAAITVNQQGKILSDMDNLKDAIAFSDDGKGVQSDEMMKQAMLKAKQLNKIIVAHCEDESLLVGGSIHDGEYAKEHGMKGISSESEWKQVERDLKLVKETGVKYHVCHISTAESVELIRQAKKEGLDVTCETAPHYLVFTDDDLVESGNFKMNPPIRSLKDKLALIKGIQDGTIDMIATDHAPHSFEEKNLGLEGSKFGIVGIETSFSVLYTYLVKQNIITLEKLIELLSVNPAKRFNINQNYDANYTIFDLSEEYTINPNDFLSKGKSTPFEGKNVFGKCIKTIYNGGTVWQDKTILK